MQPSFEYIKYLRSKKILVVGVSVRSGVGIANLLYSLDVGYSLSDSKNYEELFESRSALKDKNAVFFYNNQAIDQLKDITLIILSPGVPVASDLIQKAIRLGIEVISEIEFAYSLIPSLNYIAITGTDGKTTTCTLLYEILKNKTSTRLLGNVGNTFSNNVLEVKEGETIVLELSSFQLETIKNFHPNTSAILNLSEDHLDRYPSMQEYFCAKQNIYKNQTKRDRLVLNLDNSYTSSIINNVNNTNVFTYSKLDKNATLYIDLEDNIFYKGKYIFSILKRRILGRHNRENIIVACLIALLENVDIHTIENAVNSFSGLPHRMEFVRTLNGVVYVNDSKATSLSAVHAGVSSFDKNVILIMGGKNKGLDFTNLTPTIEKHVKTLILTGEAADSLSIMIPFKNTHIIKDFDKAIKYAYNNSENGDTVLLSPGCTSFDVFKNYEERGERFKKIILDI